MQRRDRRGWALGAGLGAGLIASLAGTGWASEVKVDKADPAYVRLQHPSNSAEHQRNLPDNPDLVVHTLSPDQVDPAVTRFLRDSYAFLDRRRIAAEAPLFVYLVGTHGAPDDAKLVPLTAAGLGYRVVNLMYDDVPATAQACDRDPDPTCSERLRQKRIYGDDVSRDIDDRPEEAVVRRLTRVLQALTAQHPDEGWGRYLEGGELDWSRLALSGHSQGAGVAAFIAKKHAVARVVLFSSPWDYYYAPGGARMPAPWLSWPSATPADRWWGLYHAKEPTAREIQVAFEALKIPPAHIATVSLEPRNGGKPHTSVSGDGSTPLDADGRPTYLPIWVRMIGKVQGSGG